MNIDEAKALDTFGKGGGLVDGSLCGNSRLR